MDSEARTPRVRARAVQDALTHLDTFREGAGDQVRGLVPAASLELIEGTSPLGWVPLDHDHHVPTAIIEVLGSADGDRYFRWLMGRHVETPLFRGVMATTRRMFGLTPGSLVRASPVGWKIAYRDVAEARAVDVGQRHAVLRLANVAPLVFDHAAYAASFAGIVGGYLDLCSVKGEVSTDVDAGQRQIDLILDW